MALGRLPSEMDEVDAEELLELQAFDMFIEPIGNHGLHYLLASSRADFINANSKPGSRPLTHTDMQWWSRENQIRQTGEFASRAELLHFLNG